MAVDQSNTRVSWSVNTYLANSRRASSVSFVYDFLIRSILRGGWGHSKQSRSLDGRSVSRMSVNDQSERTSNVDHDQTRGEQGSIRMYWAEIRGARASSECCPWKVVDVLKQRERLVVRICARGNSDARQRRKSLAARGFPRLV
jgi:hypothetical protein